MQTDTAFKRLETLPDLARTGRQVNGLYRLLTHRPLWTEGLDRIKRNKGANTPGVDGSKVTDLGESDIENTIQKLMEGTYRPKPVRRVYIPKSNGKLRPLGIPTATDRLVQEAVRSILDRIYEPIFSDWSHGFRKKRSCHTALRSVQRIWTGVKWLVEVDIRGYFDNIDHSLLLQLLGKRINDKKFLALINSMLRTGYLEQWRYVDTYSGTPQGGIISPLLANIYLHELDLYVEERMQQFNNGAGRALHPEYIKLQLHTKYARDKVRRYRNEGKDHEADEWLERYKERRSQLLRIPATDPMDSNYRRLRYVRYADDFLIGIIGTKAEAESIMKDVEEFLRTRLKLEISVEKSGVRNAKTGASFLGYDVYTFSHAQRTRKVTVGGFRAEKRTMTARMQLAVPREKIEAFAKRNDYGFYEIGVATHRPKVLHYSDVEIAKIYNAEIRGFANYYALARKAKTELGKLAWLWQTSLFKTVADKHRSTVHKIAQMSKAGPGTYIIRQQTGDKVVQVQLWRLKDLKPKVVIYANVDEVPSTNHITLDTTGIIARETVKQCIHCTTTVGMIHMHHINPLRNLKGRRLNQVTAISRKRKMVPICEECHYLLHHGKLGDTRRLVDGNGEPDDVKISSPVRRADVGYTQ